MVSVKPAKPGIRVILVVEDDQGVKRMLRFSLRNAGFALAEATTGTEALDIIKASTPAAVILDLGLPDGKSGAVLEWLRTQEDLEPSQAPVWLVISALDRQEAEARYGSIDGRFVPKPFNPWEIVQRLEQMLTDRER